MHPKRIVFIRLRSLGDLVLMTPAFEAVKRQPGMQTAIVVEEHFKSIFENNPWVDQIISVRRKASILEKISVIREIRKFNPDAVINLHGGTTSSLFAAFSGAALRVGYVKSRMDWIYNLKVPESRRIWEKDAVHTTEHQFSPLIALGFEPPSKLEPRIFVNARDLDWAQTTLKYFEVGSDFYLLHPAAAFKTKQWPAENFANLIKRMSVDGFQVVITGGPGEHDLCKKVAKFSGQDPVVIPPMPLDRFAAIASLCTIYIGNDTGTTHIAAALARPIVVIFGSSDSTVWYPWGVKHRLIRSNLPCIPCPGYHCLEYASPLCIESITTEEVYNAFLNLHREIQVE